MKDELYKAMAKIRARMMAGLQLSQEQVDNYNHLVRQSKKLHNDRG
jgi:hypothetical protein